MLTMAEERFYERYKNENVENWRRNFQNRNILLLDVETHWNYLPVASIIDKFADIDVNLRIEKLNLGSESNSSSRTGLSNKKKCRGYVKLRVARKKRAKD